MPRYPRITEERRELMTRIARQRRRLDRRASLLLDQSLLVGSWRTYVERHPGRSLLAAAGAGMALAMLAGGSARQLGRLGGKLYEAATGAAWGEVWADLKQVIDLVGDELMNEGSRRGGGHA